MICARRPKELLGYIVNLVPRHILLTPGLTYPKLRRALPLSMSVDQDSLDHPHPIRIREAVLLYHPLTECVAGSALSP